MILDYNNMDETVLHRFKGGVGDTRAKMFADERNRIMVTRLVPGSTIGLHTHETNSEIIYVLSGIATVIYDDNVETVEPGSAHYCPKGHTHSLINNEDVDLIVFAVVPEQ